MKLTVTLVQSTDTPTPGESFIMQTAFPEGKIARAWQQLVRNHITSIGMGEYLGPTHAIAFNNNGFAEKSGVHADLTGIQQKKERNPDEIAQAIGKMLADGLPYGGNVHVRIAWEDQNGAQVKTTELDLDA